MRDENGEEVGVTVSLEGAEWEYTGAGCTCSPLEKEDAGAVLPEFVERVRAVLAARRKKMKWVCFLAATFPNGNRYVFGERECPKGNGFS